MAVVILHNMLGYALGFAIAKALKMDMAKSKAISIEVGMQNSRACNISCYDALWCCSNYTRSNL